MFLCFGLELGQRVSWSEVNNYCLTVTFINRHYEIKPVRATCSICIHIFIPFSSKLVENGSTKPVWWHGMVPAIMFILVLT